MKAGLFTNGYEGYDKAVRQLGGDVRQAACWSHARRKFVGAESINPHRAEVALDTIGDLYEVDAQARDPEEGFELLQWTRKLREEQSKPILKKIKKWAASQRVLLRSPIGKAINYLLAMWPRLERYVYHPELWLDNNPTERGIRGPVVGHKYHYGSRSRRGTEVAAMIYTIFLTAKICGVDPREYIRRAVINDIDNPHTVTLPKHIEELMAHID